MRLSKKRAIELTLELWQWLYKHPDKGKFKWPEWEYNGGKYPTVINDCFACNKGPCSKCPLLPLWPDTCCPGAHQSTIYTRWAAAKSNKTRKKYAKQIVDFCKKELAK